MLWFQRSPPTVAKRITVRVDPMEQTAKQLMDFGFFLLATVKDVTSY
jgi:hypothetical protein